MEFLTFNYLSKAIKEPVAGVLNLPPHLPQTFSAGAHRYTRRYAGHPQQKSIQIDRFSIMPPGGHAFQSTSPCSGRCQPYHVLSAPAFLTCWLQERQSSQLPLPCTVLCGYRLASNTDLTRQETFRKNSRVSSLSMECLKHRVLPLLSGN